MSPAIRVDWPRATLSGALNVTRLAGGAASMRGDVAPSLFSPSIGRFTAELAGTFGGSTHQDGSRTGQMLALGRVYLMSDGGGAWTGAGLGRTWDGVVWRSVRQAEGGAWLERGGMTALATLTPVIVQDTIRYTDIQAAARYHVRSLELGFTAGARAGASVPAVGGASRAWGNLSVVAWLTSGLAVVGEAGTYPVDLTQGYPGGRFMSIALRIASRNTRSNERRAAPVRDPLTTVTEQSVAAEASAFDVRTPRRGSTERELRVYAPSAHTVEINGDFTRWQPVQLSRASDGWWTMTRAIAAGTYQMNTRVDGGGWLAPPGLLTTTDEFGGVLGILTISDLTENSGSQPVEEDSSRLR